MQQQRDEKMEKIQATPPKKLTTDTDHTHHIMHRVARALAPHRHHHRHHHRM